MATGPVSRGIHTTVLFGKETTWGAAVVPAKDIGLIQSFGNATEQAGTELHGLGQARSAARVTGEVDVKGSIEMYYQHARPLEFMLFGGTTTSVDSSTDSTHTLVWAENLPSYTIYEHYEEGTTDVCNAWKGVIFQNCTINVAVKDRVKIRGDFIGQDIDPSGTTATAATVSTIKPLEAHNASFSYNSATIPYVQSWELSVNRNSAVGFGLGSKKAAMGGSNIVNCEWRATVGFYSTAHLTRVLGGATGIGTTYDDGVTIILGADNGVTLGSGKRSLAITLTDCHIKSYSQTADLGDFVLYDISGYGYPSAASCVDQVLNAAF
jgi:hypothetical protein